MIGMRSVSRRHLGTPKSRILNCWLHNTWFILFLSLQFCVFQFQCLLSLKANAGRGSGSELDRSAVTSWDCCGFLSPALASLSPGVPYCAPDSGLCLCGSVALPVPGLCSLDCAVGKAGRNELLWAVMCRAWGGRGKPSGVSVPNQFEDFCRLAFWNWEVAWEVGMSWKQSPASSQERLLGCCCRGAWGVSEQLRGRRRGICGWASGN